MIEKKTIKMKLIIKIFVVLLFVTACKADKKEHIIANLPSNMSYAKGFDIQKYDGYNKLIIKTPYPKAKKHLEYFLIPKGQDIPEAIKHKKIIRTPIEKMVATSTTYIPMLELLEEEQSLIAFPNLAYISSPKTRKLIEQGKIQELGKEEHINVEILLNINPELVVGFSSNSNIRTFKNIEKTGIPVLLNGDWLEETPLGRAEWLKFFGALYEKEHLSDSLFNSIDEEYKKSVLIAKSAVKRLTVLSGEQFKGVWNLPAGESFVAQYLKDANTNYLWADTKGRGSLSLSFESVFVKSREADIWIFTGYHSNYSQLKENNPHYSKFNAFANGSVFTFSKKKSENGGVLYYELSPIQPHIVLKDIIKIAHPELLPDYEPFFLEKMKD
jgi:iron complex transport system substrate-binding protein